MNPSLAPFQVGLWTIEPARNQIVEGETRAGLEPKVIEVLRALAERAGEVTSREELLAAVWPETFVTDGVLTRAVSELRRALGDDQQSPRFIETIPRRGYRLIAPVHWSDALTEREPTIAVLPFADISPGSREDYFVSGLTEMLITEFAKMKAIRVISATSVRQYRDTETAIPKIAAALGADYIVEGTVTREGKEIRTTAQLIEGLSDTHLWAQSYLRHLEGSLALQGEIARQITEQVADVLAPTEHADLRRAETVDPAALEAYLRGLHLYGRRTAESVAASIRSFEEAIAIEPRLGSAHSGLADCYTLQGHYGYEPVDRVAGPARRAAEQALKLEPESGEALTSAALIELLFDWRAEAAKTRFERALEKAPSHPQARLGLADALQVLGLYEDALDQAEKAYRLNSLDPGMSMNRAGFLLICGRVDEAVGHLERTLELTPGILPARLLMTRTLAEAGRIQAAEEALAPALAERPDDPNVRLSRTWIWGSDRRRDEALAELRAIEAASEDLPLLALARSYIFLGELEPAGQLFDQAARQRLPTTLLVASHPGFAPLLDDPRVRRFREAVGLPARPRRG